MSTSQDPTYQAWPLPNLKRDRAGLLKLVPMDSPKSPIELHNELLQKIHEVDAYIDRLEDEEIVFRQASLDAMKMAIAKCEALSRRIVRLHMIVAAVTGVLAMHLIVGWML